MTAPHTTPLQIGGVALTVHDRLSTLSGEGLGLHDLGDDPAHAFHNDVRGIGLTGSAA